MFVLLKRKCLLNLKISNKNTFKIHTNEFKTNQIAFQKTLNMF